MSKLFELIEDNNFEGVETHLKLGAGVNNLDDDGLSPLLWSVLLGYFSISKLLLSYGADPNLGSDGDNDALYHAIVAGEYKLVRELVEKGADIDKAYNDGKTALDILEDSDDPRLEDALLGQAFEIDDDKEGQLDSWFEETTEDFIDLDNLGIEEEFSSESSSTAFSDDDGEGFVDLDNLDALGNDEGSKKPRPVIMKSSSTKAQMDAVIFKGEEHHGKIIDKRGEESEVKNTFNFGVKLIDGEAKGKGVLNNKITDDNKKTITNLKGNLKDFVSSDGNTKINLSDYRPSHTKSSSGPEWNKLKDNEDVPLHMKGKINNKISDTEGQDIKGLFTDQGNINAKLDPEVIIHSVASKDSKIKLLMKSMPKGKMTDEQMKNYLLVFEDYRNKKGQSGLMLAAQTGNSDLVRGLVNEGADVNALDHHGNSVLIYAVISKNFDLVKYLLDKGSRISQKNNHGLTALFFALKGQDKETFKLLLQSGANTRIKFNGMPIIIMATRKRMHEFVSLLLMFNADPKSRDEKHNKALDYAIRKKDLKLIRLLKRAEQRISDKKAA